MATKLTGALAKRVKALGISGSTEEAVKPKLLEILEENGIEHMDDEELITIVEIAETFVNDTTSDDEDENDDIDEEAEADELAEEVEEEEKPAPKKASKAATAKKEVAKKEVKEAKKTTAKSAEKAATKKGTRLNPKNNEEDRAAFDFLKKYFPESEYLYAWIAAGLTIKYKGKNSNRSIIGVENCFVKGEGKKAVMTCNVYLLLFSGKDEILEKAEIEFEKCWSGAPMLKSVESSELIEIIETLLPDMERMVKTVDKKLGDNRKKMEDNLKKEKAVKKPVSKKVVESEDDEDDEDDEEMEEAPKPVKKGKVIKKTVKK